MVIASSRTSFETAAAAAFPFAYQAAAKHAARALSPFVDDEYCRSPVRMSVSGCPVSIPGRLHFRDLNPGSLRLVGEAKLIVDCLCTRSTDGYFRHAALRNIVHSERGEVIPFVVLLAGEYVVEISEDMISALPKLDRRVYSNFVRENRAAMLKLRAKATKYWDKFYRQTYSKPTAYPGLLFLHEIERWASG